MSQLSFLLQNITRVQNGTVAVDGALEMGSADYTSTDEIPTGMAPPSPAAIAPTFLPTGDQIHKRLNQPGIILKDSIFAIHVTSS